MWGHVASSRGGSVDVDAAIALFVLAAILSVLYIILSTTIRNTTRKDIRENISKLPYEIKIYLMNTLYANADTAIKCTKCNSPSLYFRDKSGYLFSNTQEYQSEMFYESNIFCIKCIGIGDPQDTICQTDTNDLVNKLSKEKKQEKKRVSKEASKLFSHEEKTELILSLHENAENALKCPHCDLPSFYCDSNTLWQPFSPQNHEMMLLLEQHIYCIKCDLGWESISPKHTIFYLPSDTWKCHKCNTNNDNTFCPECGEKKPEPEETTKICNCGKENDATTKFCPSCGTKLRISLEKMP